MLSKETLQKILGIEETVHLTAEEMVSQLKVSFYPHYSKDTSKDIIDFSEKLKKSLSELNATVLPYDEATEYISYSRVLKRAIKLILNNGIFVVRSLLRLPQHSLFISWKAYKSSLRRKRIKKGVSIIVLGEQPEGQLPMELIYSFKATSIVSILNFPKNIHEESDFMEHFDTAMSLFAYHMTNIVIAVNSQKWMLYNFNASHPIYALNDGKFNEHVLHALIPKIVAPISPHKLSEFTILDQQFNVEDTQHKDIIESMVNGALLFGKTNLYPVGKQIDALPFRNTFYKWIGKLHLDNRSGMSFGFLAHQMPVILSEVISLDDAKKKFGSLISDESDYFIAEENIYIIVHMQDKDICLKVPEIWVMSQRSGSDKIHINKTRDLLKLGLHNGKMYIQTPQGLKLHADYKTSFDTKVILAHAVGNAVVASILEYLYPGNTFSLQLKRNGAAIAHWHGYFHPARIPSGWIFHGVENPHVACSSPQSAMYALDGKLRSFSKHAAKVGYRGDIHIEPHHGSNICFTTLPELAEMLVKDPQISILGNKYLYLYK